MSNCYILETPANWFFRRSVPADLRLQIGKREIKISLRTGSKQVAIQRARELACQTDALFRTLRGGEQMSKRVLIPGLSEMLLESKHSLPDGSVIERRVDISEQELQILMNAGYSKQLADRILARIDELSLSPVRELASVAFEPIPAPPAVAIDRHEEIDCAIDHDPSEDIDYKDLRLSDAIEKFMEFGDTLDRWKNSKITDEAKADLLLLVEVVGDRPMGAVTPAMALKFRQALTRIPKRRKLSVKYRDRKLRDLIADAKIPKSDLFKETYITSLITTCSSLFNWAFKGAYNPFSDLRKKERGAKSDKRDSFNDDELLLIFSHEIFKGKKKPNKVYQYWSPLIALLTGMRQTEIAQLYLSNISVRDGVYGIDMTPDSESEDNNKITEDTLGQTYKTEKSRRFVPVPEKLLELGFAERVDRLKALGETRLFTELYYWETDPNRDKPDKKVYVGQTISKWFNGPNRFLDSLGITSEKLVFHSFRKNFITEMGKRGIAKEDRTAIVGHEDGDAHDIYITEFDYVKLKRLIDLVDFKHVLNNVKPWNLDWK